MTYQVSVKNEGRFDIRERFKGKEIFIGAGDSKVMDRDEAVEFASQYKPIITDGENNQKPEGFKKLSFNPPLYGYQPNEASNLVCHATGEVATNEAHMKQLIQKNAHLLADDTVKQQVIKEQKAEIEASRDRIAELEAKLAESTGKRGAGRPKKGANNNEQGS